MKTILYFAAAVMLGCTMNGATLLFRRDGTPYSLRDWSSPELLALNSSRGPVQALKRTNLVDRMDSQYTERLSIDLVYSPTSQAVLVGHPYEHYFAIGEEIYGAATQGTDLLIKRSDSPGSGDFETIKDRAITEFVKDPGTAFSVLGATYAFDLTRIFGHDAILPENNAVLPVKPVTITHVGIGPTSVTFGFSAVSGSDLMIFALHTVAGNDLILTFGHEFDLISASKNGEAVLVLQDGRFPLVLDWPGARAISLPSESGPVPGLTSNKVYYRDHKRYYNEEGQGRLAFPMRVVAIPSTGNLWIGPIDSRLLVQNGSVVGFLPSKGNELLVFTGRPRTIHAEDARITYQQELSNFENDLLAGRFAEKSRVNISTFLPASDASLTINDIFFADSDIVLRLIASGPKGNSKVELKIGRDLRVTSAEAMR